MLYSIMHLIWHVSTPLNYSVSHLLVSPSKLSLTSTEWVWVVFLFVFFFFFLTNLFTPCSSLMIVSFSFWKLNLPQAVKVAQAGGSPPCSCLCWVALVTVPMGALCHHAWLLFVKASFGQLFPTFLMLSRKTTGWQLLWHPAKRISSIQTSHSAKDLAEIRQGQYRYSKALSTLCDHNV